MIDFIIVFFLIFIISFAGSIHLGTVNLAVIETTLSKNLKAGLWLSAGGSVPEIFYAIIAILGQTYLQKNAQITLFFNWLVVPVFLIIGFMYFFQNQKETTINAVLVSDGNFKKGFWLAMTNPQLLPFWLVVATYLSSRFAIGDFSIRIAFVLGAALGAFAILGLFAFITQKLQSKISPFLTKYPLNKIVGLLFIIMALIQLVKMIGGF
jgi:threonine/homoserine/homoserine lactone efflux protein